MRFSFSTKHRVTSSQSTQSCRRRDAECNSVPLQLGWGWTHSWGTWDSNYTHLLAISGKTRDGDQRNTAKMLFGDQSWMKFHISSSLGSRGSVASLKHLDGCIFSKHAPNCCSWFWPLKIIISATRHSAHLVKRHVLNRPDWSHYEVWNSLNFSH